MSEDSFKMKKVTPHPISVEMATQILNKVLVALFPKRSIKSIAKKFLDPHQEELSYQELGSTLVFGKRTKDMAVIYECKIEKSLTLINTDKGWVDKLSPGSKLPFSLDELGVTPIEEED